MSDRVFATLKPVLVDLCDDADPECWITWGDDAGRYSILAPTVAGLVTVAVRVGSPVEGPRANGKLIRWPKLAVTELNLEATGEHRLVAVQIENLVLKGVDAEADRICEFVRALIASVDGRTAKPIHVAVAQRGPATAAVAVAGPQKKVVPARTVAATPRRVVAPAPARRAPAAVAPRAASAPKPPSGTGRKVTATPAKPAAAKPQAARATRPAATKPPAARTAKPAAATRARKAAAVPAPIRALPPGKPGRPDERAPEPVVDLPEWVSPHPIEEPPAHEPIRPRPWMP